MPAARVEHLGARGADPARSPSLFAGMVAVASTSMASGLRASTSMSRCVCPIAPTPHNTLRRLTDALVCGRRLPGLLFHHVQGPGSAAFIAEKLHMVRRHFSSTRACLRWREGLQSSRADAFDGCRSCSPAREPTPGPMWTSQLSSAACRVCVVVPRCALPMWVALALPPVGPEKPCS